GARLGDGGAPGREADRADLVRQRRPPGGQPAGPGQGLAQSHARVRHRLGRHRGAQQRPLRTLRLELELAAPAGKCGASSYSRGMKTRAGWAALLLVLAPLASASADDPERYAMSRLRLTTEAARTKGCLLVGSVSDDSVKDLRRKILRIGGDTALLTFGIEDPSKIYAQVYRCPAAAAPA